MEAFDYILVVATRIGPILYTKINGEAHLLVGLFVRLS
jgi:hypothetical protein